jgi:hypothetical protein
VTVEHPQAPPSAERVARRALILAAVVCRGTIEEDAGDADAEVLRQSLPQWLDDVGIASDVEPEELTVLHAPLGSLTPQQRIDATWRAERLAVLAWALGRYELPAYDYQCDPFAIAQSLGFRHPREKTVLRDPRLRTPEELASLAGTLRSLSQGLTDGTLTVRGVPMSETVEPVQRAIMRIAGERRQVADWLIGQAAT